MLRFLLFPCVLQILLEKQDHLVFFCELLCALLLFFLQFVIALILYIQTCRIPELPDMHFLCPFLCQFLFQMLYGTEIPCPCNLVQSFHLHVFFTTLKSFHAVFKQFDLKKQFLPFPYVLIHFSTTPPFRVSSAPLLTAGCIFRSLHPDPCGAP